MSLSVVIITRDEAAKLRACLESVAFADEVVVLDSGSTDDTVRIAQAFGARVSVTADWPGFGIQKNRAIGLATSDWVLSLDADERVTPALREQLLAAMARADFEVYSFNRRSAYCGQYMNHSGWYPDRITRLFRRGVARFSDDLVHESLQTLRPLLPIGRIEADLLHDSFTDFDAVLDKLNRYSTAGARALFNKGVKGSPGKAIGHGLWAFVRTYVLRRGFLDGRLGLALAVSNAEGTYYRYFKLWLMQRQAAQARQGAQEASSRP